MRISFVSLFLIFCAVFQLNAQDTDAAKKLLDQVQITTSVPEKIPLHPTKINILWQKNSYDQPNLAPWFQDKSNHHKYDWYVFNSHWTFEKFRMLFDLPLEKCLVIKNGIDKIQKAKPYEKDQPIKIIHQNNSACWFTRSDIGYGDSHLGIYDYPWMFLDKYNSFSENYPNEDLEQNRILGSHYRVMAVEVEYDGREINNEDDL